MLGLVQSPDVLEGSSVVGDVLVANINGECRLLVELMAERNSVEGGVSLVEIFGLLVVELVTIRVFEPCGAWQ